MKDEKKTKKQLIEELEKLRKQVASIDKLEDLSEKADKLEFKSLLLNSVTDSIFVTDLDGEIIYTNQSAYKERDSTKEELIGSNISKLLTPECAKLVKPRLKPLLESGSAVFESAHIRKDGTVIPVEVSARVVEIDGKKLVITIDRDITERKQAEEALEKSRDFYLSLFEEFPSLIWRSGTDGKCDYFNKSWLEFTGRTLRRELGDGWAEGVHPEDLDHCISTYLRAFKARRPFEMEYRLRRHDGEYRWIVDYGRPFNDLNGNFAGYIGTCNDITERKKQEEELAYLATHDPLTGLSNRRALEEHIKRVRARARMSTISALLLMDLDNFKFVNDTLGHAAGDHVLVTITQLLRRKLRVEDQLARLGGDEFAVLLEDVSKKEALIVAERLRKSAEEFKFNIDKQSLNITLSIGVAIINGSDGPESIMSRADDAMYKAKERGRNQVVLYKENEHDSASRKAG